MRILMPIALAALFATSTAFADTCTEQATEKKLAGAAKASFLKKCEADSKPAAHASCEATAAEKKLAGAAKTSFLKKCEADAKGGAPKADAKPTAAVMAAAACADKATEKKLAGAAKNSFMKKCEEDAKDAKKK